MRDYYAELGLEPNASTDAIKQAYRRLARTVHPDINPGAAASERFQRITEAYHVLADSRQRMAYNQELLRAAADPIKAPTGVAGLTKREIRAAAERVVAYTVTVTLTAVLVEYTVRWLLQLPFARPDYLLMGGVGSVVGAIWGIDANFVISDFIVNRLVRFLFRFTRYAVWMFGVAIFTNHLRTIVELFGLHRHALVLTASDSALPLGIGFLIASYWTWRDH